MVVSQGRSPLLLPHRCPRKSPGEAAGPGAELKSSHPQSWSGGHRSRTIAQAPVWVFLKGLFLLRAEHAWAARRCRISRSLELHVVWATVGSRTWVRSRGETNVAGDIVWTPASPVLEPASIDSSRISQSLATVWPLGPPCPHSCWEGRKDGAALIKSPFPSFQLRAALLLSLSAPGRPPTALHAALEAVSQIHGHRQSRIQPLPVSSSVIQMAHPRDAVTQIMSLLPPWLRESPCRERSSFWPPWFMPSGAGISRHWVFNCARV